jgi:hypothetical protein
VLQLIRGASWALLVVGEVVCFPVLSRGNAEAWEMIATWAALAGPVVVLLFQWVRKGYGEWWR